MGKSLLKDLSFPSHSEKLTEALLFAPTLMLLFIV